MIIGLYGYIGAGKTTASHYLVKNYHFYYINADEIAKHVMNTPVVEDYLRQNYPDIFINGKYDRIKLREILFTDKKANMELNKITWPLVETEIKKQILKVKNQDILIEAVGLNSLKIPFDYKFFITANLKLIYERVLIRDNVNTQQTKAILRIQKSLFRQNKQYIKIKTTKNVQVLYDKIDKVMQNIRGDK